MSLRGTQVAPVPALQDMKDLWAFGCRFIRQQLVVPDERNTTTEDWKASIREQLSHLASWLWRDELRFKVVLDIHSPPLGPNFLGSVEARNALIEMWREIALHYRSLPGLTAYGILNEAPGEPDFVGHLMYSCAREIRKIDRRTPIAVTCPYSDPGNFSKIATLSGIPNLWREFHMYTPFALTHQGIYGTPVGAKYPTAKHNKTWLRSLMRQVMRFQDAHPRDTIFVGEFSVSDFADPETRYNYNKDCIDIFNERGWSFTYHAFREANVWSAENNTKLFTLLKSEWKR